MVSEIRVGQVVVMRGSKILNRLIQMGLGNYWSHVGWIVKVEEQYVYIQESKATKGKVVTNRYPKHLIYSDYEHNMSHILDFKIRPNTEFYNIVRKNEGVRYDYLANLIHFWQRIKELLTKQKHTVDYESKDHYNCSEMISRSIAQLKDIDVLKITKRKTFDKITPQDIKHLHDKCQDLGLV